MDRAGDQSPLQQRDEGSSSQRSDDLLNEAPEQNVVDQVCCGNRLGHSAGGFNQQTQYPPAPYEHYTPMPGIIPPVNPPYYESKKPEAWCRPAPVVQQGSCVIPATQPVIPVPVTQNVIKKETVVEVDQLIVTDKVQPNVYRQEVYHEIPRLAYDIRERKVPIPNLEIEQVDKEVEVPVGFNFQVKHTWNEREVPRLFPRYCGPQEVIEVGIPQIQIVDKRVDNEIPLYMGEKYVEKEIVEDEGVEVITYQYVHREEEVPVYKYRPVFDVQVSIPPPLIVPVPLRPQEVTGGTNRISWEEYQKLRKQKRQCGSLKAPLKELRRTIDCSRATVCGTKLNCCAPDCLGCDLCAEARVQSSPPDVQLGHSSF